MSNKGMEMDFKKLALFKTTHARRWAQNNREDYGWEKATFLAQIS
jgi:hypothetical protein